jgi:hypothetical protein
MLRRSPMTALLTLPQAQSGLKFFAKLCRSAFCKLQESPIERAQRVELAFASDLDN